MSGHFHHIKVKWYHLPLPLYPVPRPFSQFIVFYANCMHMIQFYNYLKNIFKKKRNLYLIYFKALYLAFNIHGNCTYPEIISDNSLTNRSWFWRCYQDSCWIIKVRFYLYKHTLRPYVVSGVLGMCFFLFPEIYNSKFCWKEFTMRMNLGKFNVDRLKFKYRLPASLSRLSTITRMYFCQSKR